MGDLWYAQGVNASKLFASLLAAQLCLVGPLGCDRFGKDSAPTDDDGGKKKKKKKRKKKSDDDDDELEVGDDGLARSKDGSIPAPKKGQWKPPKAGSWVRLASTEPNPAAPTITNSWLEIRNGDEYLVQSEMGGQAGAIVQAWVKVVDLQDLHEDNIELLSVKAKIGPLGVQTIKQGTNPIYDRMLDQVVSTIEPANVDGLPQEDVKTPVGLFRKAYKLTRTVTLMGITSTSTIYIHPAVPAGAVQIESKEWTLQLAALDDEGAKSAF